MWSSSLSTATFRAALGLLAATVALGCYKPRIDDGGYLCGLDRACPAGLSCAEDGRCWRDTSGHLGDAGGPACTTPHVTPLCADEPLPGEACNPTCQTGCECGRCNVVDGVPKCVDIGSVKLGEVCKLGKDDNCAPGLVCQKELCGNNLGRCYRYCATNDQCGGTICQIPNPTTAFKVCDVAPQACDPVGDTGCPELSLHCFLTGANQTLCDCPNHATGKGLNGDPCIIYNDCAPKFVCIASGGETRCHFACSVANTSCPGDVSCDTTGLGGGMYGHCP